jgi:DNA-binding NarL/FixJ family response regulator
MRRVLIVDDQPHFRRYLRRLLAQAKLAVVGEAGSIAETRLFRSKSEMRPLCRLSLGEESYSLTNPKG